MISLRNDGRTYDQVRPLKITFNPFGFADTTLLYEQGGTKVLVGITLQDGVPHFLKGKGVGWLTAEYAMLPISTRGRTKREISQMRPNSRNVEISRIIGRSLRSVVNLSRIGERTIFVDCDVLQADGGTRCACITAASFALNAAISKWIESDVLYVRGGIKQVVSDSIAAISVGMMNGVMYLDLDQSEDNCVDADFNFILTQSGDIVELQGTSEKCPTSWENFEQIKKLALSGVEQIFKVLQVDKHAVSLEGQGERKAPLFSLGRRAQPKE